MSEEKAPEWRVSLRGNDYDLRDFAKLFKSLEARVLVEKDGYSLTSSKFEDLEDVNEVIEQAADLVGVLNGVAKIRCQTFDEISVSTVSRDNGDGSWQSWLSLFMKAVIRVEDENKLSDGFVYANHEAETNNWVSLSDTDTQIQDALRFFSETPTTWWSLRKVCEAIEGSKNIQASNFGSRGWADREETERFKNWAGYYVHAELSRPADKEEMTLEQAKEFVRSLLANWLNDVSSKSTGGNLNRDS